MLPSTTPPRESFASCAVDEPLGNGSRPATGLCHLRVAYPTRGDLPAARIRHEGAPETQPVAPGTWCVSWYCRGGVETVPEVYGVCMWEYA